MKQLLRYLLLAEGTSDEVLMDIIDWCLEQSGWLGSGEFVPKTDQARNASLAERIVSAVADVDAVELVFIHGDADSRDFSLRKGEIESAIRETGVGQPCIAIVPVYETEAWLLTDESAIRGAAGNPNGRNSLDLPQLSRLESLNDPKGKLNELLRDAYSHRRRLRRGFREREARRQIPRYTATFAPLRRLSAFALFERELNTALTRLKGDR